MDLSYTDEQRLLRESVERFVTESYNADHRRRVASDPLGFSPAIWQRFAELGWLALPIGEAYGGLGGGAIEIGIMMEAFGRGLVTEPYLSTVVLCAGLVERCGTQRQKQAILPRIADGSMRLALAHSERQARFELADIATSASKVAGAWRLSGNKIAVLDGHAADQIIVSARLHHQDGSSGGLGLFLVTAETAGVTISDFPRLGGGRACNLKLADVHLGEDALFGENPDVLDALEWSVGRAIAALGAEAVGIMQTLLDATVEYTRIRHQFGRPLLANQVVRHRLADMAMQCDEARSMALRAALMVEAEPRARGRAISGAKAKIGRCARFVGEQAIQLHGGMGVTEELEIGAYFKRLVAFEALFGPSAHHYRRHAALGRATAV